MAPTSIKTLLSRDNDPSLRQLFHVLPATVWSIFKVVIFGASLIFAVFAIIFAVFFVSSAIYLMLKSVNLKAIIEGSREKLKCLRGRNTSSMAEADDAEELRHLGTHDSDEREGSVGGETLFEGQGNEDGEDDGIGHANKEEMELDSEDYMKGEA